MVERYNSAGSAPSKLNFYFAVTLTFEDSGEATVYLGQGHAGLDNPWWFGGATLFNDGTAFLGTSTGQNYKVKASGAGIFKLSYSG